MKYATVTTASPLKVTVHGTTVEVPVGDTPAGSSFVVDDVVLVETFGRRTVIVQKMAGP